MKLYLGSNNKKIEGFLSVDVQKMENVDVVHDLTIVPYPFVKENSVDEIFSEEFLEHISFRHTYPVLKEWRKILKKYGTINIQVPDCGKAMEYYVNNQICECVPHKDETGLFKANEKCFSCGGKAKINPTRWQYSFTGAQKNNFDAHLNFFTKEKLEQLLVSVGFSKIEFTPDINKLKVKAIKL